MSSGFTVYLSGGKMLSFKADEERAFFPTLHASGALSVSIYHLDADGDVLLNETIQDAWAFAPGCWDQMILDEAVEMDEEMWIV